MPLFVEELTRTVIEAGLVSNIGGRFGACGPLPPLAIPTTLHDTLMARLDRLAVVKEVAQMAACIGRQFSHELIAAVAPMSAEQLAAALDQLVAAQLVFRRGTTRGRLYLQARRWCRTQPTSRCSKPVASRFTLLSLLPSGIVLALKQAPHRKSWRVISLKPVSWNQRWTGG